MLKPVAFVTAFILVTIAAPCPAIPPTDQSVIAPPEIKVEGTTYRLVVVVDPRRLVRESERAAASGGKVVIESASRIKRGEDFGPVVTFTSCEADPTTGNCGLYATYRIFAPNGTLAIERPDVPVWVGPPPSKKNPIHLCVGLWVTQADATDPLGKQVMEAKVVDRVAKRTAVLKRGFELRAE